MIELYGIIGVLILIIGFLVFLWVKNRKKLKTELTEANRAVWSAEAKLIYLRHELDQALDYESRDSDIKRKVELNIEHLRKAETDDEVKKEIDNIRTNIRNISHSL